VRTDVDVVVVGSGVTGAMAAKALAERGRHTLLLERYRLGNRHGSSHGPSRIVRVTDYHPDYVRLNRLALRGWEELQAAAGETLLVRTGNLEIGEGAQVYADALEAAGEPFEWLAPEEARERWPSLLLRDDERTFVQENGGVCLADRTVRAAARLAVGAGAELREDTRVERISDHGSFAEVVVDGRAIRSPVVVVTAGAWAGTLLADAGLDLPLVPTLEQVSYYRLEEPSALPTVIDYTVDPEVDHYAVPHPTQTGSFKLALDHAGPAVDPDARSFDPDPARLERAEAWGRSRFSSLIPADAPETCLYTNTPDNDYVLDRVGAVVVGSACSGHGFKASPVVGRILADLATGSRSSLPLGRFLMSRPALRPGG
jgi:sarcosine oxidase